MDVDNCANQTNAAYSIQTSKSEYDGKINNSSIIANHDVYRSDNKAESINGSSREFRSNNTVESIDDEGNIRSNKVWQ